MTMNISQRHAKPTLNEAIAGFLDQHDAMSFVQVGGFDGVSFDPLRPFIEGGRLSGLIIEPLSEPFAKLQALYADSTVVSLCHCAIAEEDGEMTMWRFKQSAIEDGLLNAHFGGISSFRMEDLLADDGSLGRLFADQERIVLRSLVEPVNVTARSLSSVMTQYGLDKIDLLQIDTEGYDLHILNAFDFEKSRPTIVNFEHIHLSEDDRRKASDLLAGLGYSIFPQEADTLAIHGFLHEAPEEDQAVTVFTDFDGLRGNVIFCTWTGQNPLTPQRAEALLSIYRETSCPVLFLTPRNIDEWVVPHSPMHPALRFLSETHKADYLRCYLMHHFGGGYTDLKHTQVSWTRLFEIVRSHPDATGLGYREIGPEGVASCGGLLEVELRENFHKLIGNCAYIFRKGSAFTSKWLALTHELLDRKIDALKANPAQHPMDQHNVTLPDGSVSKYPLRWQELLGEIFHPLVYEFSDSIIQGEIAPSFKDYR